MYLVLDNQGARAPDPHPLAAVGARAAFEARNYADYTDRITAAPLAGHAPQAILLGGPRKAVDRICGNLPLLR